MHKRCIILHTNNIKSIERQYNQLLRCLLGISKNTNIDLCLAESVIPPLHHVLAKRRCNFIKSKLETNDPDQPFTFAFRLLSENNIPAYHFLASSLRFNSDINPFSRLINIINVKAQMQQNLTPILAS